MPSMSQAIEVHIAAVASADPYAGAKRSLREAIAAVRPPGAPPPGLGALATRRGGRDGAVGRVDPGVRPHHHRARPSWWWNLDGEVCLFPWAGLSAVDNAQAYLRATAKQTRPRWASPPGRGQPALLTWTSWRPIWTWRLAVPRSMRCGRPGRRRVPEAEAKAVPGSPQPTAIANSPMGCRSGWAATVARTTRSRSGAKGRIGGSTPVGCLAPRVVRSGDGTPDRYHTAGR